MTNLVATELPPAPRITRSQIDQKARQLFYRYIAEVGEEHVSANGIDFDEMFESVLYPLYEVSIDTSDNLGLDEAGEQIWGIFLPEDNIAVIDREIARIGDPRRVFTLYHEVAGHGILHGEHLRRAGVECRVFRTTEASINDGRNVYEKQANLLAAGLAAPSGFIRFLWYKLFGSRRKIRYVGPGAYSLCLYGGYSRVWANSPLHLAWMIAKRIGHYFGGLSMESLAYHVLEAVVDSNGFDNLDFKGQSPFSLATFFEFSPDE